MENFAIVIRTLLSRIRAFEASRSRGTWPPTAAAVVDPAHRSRYPAAEATWGLVDPDESSQQADRAPKHEGASDAAQAPGSAPAQPPTRARRERLPYTLELTAYGLPVPRGLPST